MESFSNTCDLSENQIPISNAGLDQTTSYNQVVTLRWFCKCRFRWNNQFLCVVANIWYRSRLSSAQSKQPHLHLQI